MGKKKKRGFIKPPVEDELKVNLKKAENKSSDSPVFSFKYLVRFSYHECKNVSFFIEYIERLKRLSELGWKGIHTSGRHNYGMEKIPITQIKKQLNDISIITPDVEELTVFRATSENHPFLGLRMGNIFYVLLIETSFGDVYNHGRK